MSSSGNAPIFICGGNYVKLSISDFKHIICAYYLYEEYIFLMQLIHQDKAGDMYILFMLFKLIFLHTNISPYGL